ncbi:MAG: endonuclease/exonuclease/phosphatase family protein [Deltaproteobacteria bacterium]|nr:endonuclease/exonuclease/phosphatase family protein [Deltaproteobacteria bacterium]
MHVMTFNIRFDNERDGPDAWPLRSGLVTGLIKKYNPSILGTQEGMWSQLEYLRDHLPGYRLHAPHRTIDSTCQYPTLLFHKDNFDVHEGGDSWLSLTPEIHRSKNWDSAFPRMMSYAKVSTVNGREPFWLAVTHLDHIGTEARYQQAKIIAAWVKERTGPVILMGDFNDSPGSPVHDLLTSPETGLKDTWNVLGHGEDSDSFTHHRFTGSPQETRMDWVLISPHFKIIKAEIIRDNHGGRYPSDHFPYLVELDLTKGV